MSILRLSTKKVFNMNYFYLSKVLTAYPNNTIVNSVRMAKNFTGLYLSSDFKAKLKLGRIFNFF